MVKKLLNVYIGDYPGEIYNPALYFKNQYEPEWLTSELGRQMIFDVDKSKVIGANLIESPVLGPIPPERLSGGVKTLLLMAFDVSGNIFNATACCDKCAKWILQIAEKKDLTITLHHSMRFGNEPYEIRILNTGVVVHNQQEWIDNVFSLLEYNELAEADNVMKRSAKF